LKYTVLTVVTEARFYRNAAGAIVCCEGGRAYSFWTRYLSAFENVRVIARVSDKQADGSPVEGPGVYIVPIRDVQGLRQWVIRASGVLRQVARECSFPGAYLLRLPGVLGSTAAAVLRKRDQAYAVELVGDPFEVLSGTSGNPLRKAVGLAVRRGVAFDCSSAAAVAYVTRTALQRRYPAAAGAITAAYSSITLSNEWVASSARDYTNWANPIQTRRPVRAITVCRLNYPYKGVDVLLEAVRDSLDRGLLLQLTVIGDGVLRPALERRARELGLEHMVTFAGQLASGLAIRDRLDQEDVFLLASRTEGLPRALIEAMARALPCVATGVGGVPELLPDADLVPPGRPHAFTDKLLEVVSSGHRLAAMSSVNLEVARNFHVSLLEKRRNDFYRQTAERFSALNSNAVHV
jgi:glycosyltransferase involved in cell wall biosynthesis